MRYSTEPRFRKYVEGHGFFSFARKFGNKYGKKINGYCNKNRNRYSKNYLKKSSSKTAEATGDLIGNKIADKITSIGKPKEKEETNKVERIYIPREKRQQIIDDLKLF